MGYDIPDEIKYKEKIVANLDLKQLGYAILFGILAFFSLKLPIQGEIQYILPSLFAVIGIAFIYFNFEQKALDVLSYYGGLRNARYDSKTAQKFFEVKSVENDAIQLDDETILAILEIQPINFALLDEHRKKALLVNYRAFLNQLTTPIQIFVKTKEVNLTDYFNGLKDNVECRGKLLTDLYADFRIFEEDFLRTHTIRQRRYYLAIPLNKTMIGQSTSIKQLNDLVEITIEKLGSCDLKAKRLMNGELEELYSSYADGSNEKTNAEKPKEELESKDEFRNRITPSFDIKPNYAIVNGEYHQIVKVVGYPRNVENGWLQTFLSKNENYDISIHITPSSINSMLVYLHNQILQQASDLFLSTAKGTPNPSLEIKKADTMQIYNSLYKGEEKMFELALYIDNKANDFDELNLLAEKCKSNLNSQLMMPKIASWRMADGIKSTLPLAKDKLNSTRDILSGALTATLPFIATANTNQRGILFAHENQTLSPIFLDLENQSNKHFFIIGISGSGKSYAAKYFFVQQLFKSETRLYVLDPNGEYSKICKSLNGKIIEISKESKYILNIFDLNGEDLGSKLLQLVSAFDIIMGGLNEGQKAVLSDAISTLYTNRGIVPDKSETWSRPPPRFSDLRLILEEMLKQSHQSTPQGRSLDAIYRRVKMYCEGGVFGFLDQDTSIEAENQVVCFDLSKLPPAIKPLMIFSVLSLIQQKIMKDKEPKNVLIDEGWVLLRSKEAEQYLLEFVKSSRKFNASVGFITQDVEDLLQSSTGKSILNTASVKILMRQSPSSINIVASNLRLNEYEQNYLLTAKKGQGLVIAEDNSYCFSIQAPPKIHQLITTNPNEAELVVEDKNNEKVPLNLHRGLYLRSELSSKQVGELVARGYALYDTRITTKAPHIEYLVKLRPKEGDEHGFLCWWTESLLLKKGIKSKLVSTRGPDLELTLNDKKICFEIETGKRLKFMKKTEMAARFKERRKQYDQVHVIVPNERIGREYAGLADSIITKAELEGFIDKFLGTHNTVYGQNA